ncbi:HD-GYP domain-containing protein [Methylobacterium planeticum]|uniref:HD domain-containing protein n=1 Tax=Methylobacterium planeticum TaxID=2615211 RepID=A0A6N6MFJ1_9HYPH|nr:HD domain-containing phosphohydrolase [Methylobacterium planeticum]KAB1068123.1 HD domain-containing protein [Methylobacterium planeticum]
MQNFLLLTDTPARGQRLARGLSPLGLTLVVDLLDPGQDRVRPDPATVRAVISDISFATSPPIAGLRRHLDRLGGRPPFLCLLHEDTPRSQAQAQALGATRTLRADQAERLLISTLSHLTAPAEAGMIPAAEAEAAPTPLPKPAPVAAPRTVTAAVPVAQEIARADVALTRIFDLGRSGGAIEPHLITAGADLIEGALRNSDVRAWLDVVWRFDDATHQHCLLVAGLAAGFAKHLGLRRADCQQLTQAALLHDVGKSRIPIAILNKPGRLDADEMTVMREHPVLGHRMLRDQGYPEAMLAVVRSHHEMLDGSGYPDRLQACEIPDLVRLVTICDIFGALIERRPYKRPMAGPQAFAILEGMGGKLDQDLLRAFRPIADATGNGALEASA